MKRVLVAVFLVSLVASPAEAAHKNWGGHWAGSGVRTIDVYDAIAKAYSGEQLERWRSFRDGAFRDWEASGAVAFVVDETPSKRQSRWDGVCWGGYDSGVYPKSWMAGGADILLCQSSIWSIYQANYDRRGGWATDHIAWSVIALAPGFAAGYPTCEPNCQKYIAHELGHSLGLGHRPISDCFSVMSYCSGWYRPDSHDLEDVVSLNGHEG